MSETGGGGAGGGMEGSDVLVGGGGGEGMSVTFVPVDDVSVGGGISGAGVVLVGVSGDSVGVLWVESPVSTIEPSTPRTVSLFGATIGKAPGESTET